MPEPVQMCCLETKTDFIRCESSSSRAFVKSCQLSAGPAQLHWRNLSTTGREGRKEGAQQKDQWDFIEIQGRAGRARQAPC